MACSRMMSRFCIDKGPSLLQAQEEAAAKVRVAEQARQKQQQRCAPCQRLLLLISQLLPTRRFTLSTLLHLRLFHHSECPHVLKFANKYLCLACREAEEKRRKAELRAKRADEENKRKVNMDFQVQHQLQIVAAMCNVYHGTLADFSPEERQLMGSHVVEQEAVQQADERERKRKQDAAKMQVRCIQWRHSYFSEPLSSTVATHSANRCIVQRTHPFAPCSRSAKKENATEVAMLSVQAPQADAKRLKPSERPAPFGQRHPLVPRMPNASAQPPATSTVAQVLAPAASGSSSGGSLLLKSLVKAPDAAGAEGGQRQTASVGAAKQASTSSPVQVGNQDEQSWAFAHLHGVARSRHTY